MDANFNEVILSLGSNLGSRSYYLNKAINLLKAEFDSSFKVSNFYESEPWGFESNNNFLNCCVCFLTAKTPLEILEITQGIEKKIGRKSKTKENNYKSRIIDIDIIFIGDMLIKSKELTVPHPYLYHRNFVLIPLLEIYPNWIDISTGKTIEELLKSSKDNSKIKIYNP
ncbi:MAG: 2-amino-4-hydroxy-6-hydroxymethyldihydropteridine diphosphokinase [Brumimicrobium sp.]